MRNRFHVAVLEADTLFEPIRSQRGTFGDIYKKGLEAGLKKLGHQGKNIELSVSKYDVVTDEAYPDLNEIDCLFVSGSKHRAFNDDPWILKLAKFIRHAFDHTSLPIIGICFGHQIVNRALGGTVGDNPRGWEVSVDRVDLTEEGQKFFGKRSLALYQSHMDMVTVPGKGMQILGYSDICPIQILYNPGRVFTMQAHPEFDSWIMREVLLTLKGNFDEEFYLDAMKRVELHHDGALVFGAVWKFMLGINTHESHHSIV